MKSQRRLIAWLSACLWLCAVTQVSARIKTEEVHYQAGDTKMTGYLAYDADRETKGPGVLVVHEWWGHNQYARKRAEMLAALGYTALAVDMYGDGKLAEHPDDAKAFMQAVISHKEIAEARFDAARKLLQEQPMVDKDQLAAIGYCFGGGVVLQMARAGKDLKGVVSFHGSLGTDMPAEKGTVKAEILVFNGDADPFVTREQREAFAAEMKAADVQFELINYPDVKHSFTNPEADALGKRFDMPLAYNAKADEDSWKRMQEFFRYLFSQDDEHKE